jgi:2-polyprenyl-6-methoxyphenol hydroxylase-like FAD-dependent oxidoreductase
LLAVQQPRLVEVLAERAVALGVEIRWEHTVTGIEQTDDAVSVAVCRPDGLLQLSAGYLAGADGGRSSVRKLCGIDFPGTSMPEAVMRIARGVQPPQGWVDPVSGALTVPGFGRVPQIQFQRTEGGVFAWGVPGGLSMVATVELSGAVTEAPGRIGKFGQDLSIEEMQDSIVRVLGAEVPLLEPRHGQSTLRRFVGLNSRIAAPYRAGRVFVAGDAAHVHSPLGAPALNLGLQDAANLGWKLAAVLRDGADPALLDTYEAERRPAAERVIMHSRAQLALIAPGPDVAALRVLFEDLMAQPSVQERLAHLVSGAADRYPTVSDSHPMEGRWVPELTLTTPDGLTPVRVASLARDGRPVLLDLSAERALGSMAGECGARVHTVCARLAEVPPDPVCAMLIRPDGYVGWAAAKPSQMDRERLRQTLRSWCAAATFLD